MEVESKYIYIYYICVCAFNYTASRSIMQIHHPSSSLFVPDGQDIPTSLFVRSLLSSGRSKAGRVQTKLSLLTIYLRATETWLSFPKASWPRGALNQDPDYESAPSHPSWKWEVVGDRRLNWVPQLCVVVDKGRGSGGGKWKGKMVCGGMCSFTHFLCRTKKSHHQQKKSFPPK